MLRPSSSPLPASRIPFALLLAALVLALPALLSAQTTVAAGSIQGTITDPSGAVVNAAQVTISNKANGQTVHVRSSSAGTYTSGALQPGTYTVHVEAPGFKTA